jgi:hypothetical protein
MAKFSLDNMISANTATAAKLAEQCAIAVSCRFPLALLELLLQTTIR